jgi:hypothetical protein
MTGIRRRSKTLESHDSGAARPLARSGRADIERVRRLAGGVLGAGYGRPERHLRGHPDSEQMAVPNYVALLPGARTPGMSRASWLL